MTVMIDESFSVKISIFVLLAKLILACGEMRSLPLQSAYKGYLEVP